MQPKTLLETTLFLRVMHNKFDQIWPEHLEDMLKMWNIYRQTDDDGRIAIAIAHLLTLDTGELKTS